MIRRLSALLAIVLVATALAACGGSSSTGDLTGKSWQWTASTTKVPASQAVTPDPENYTVTFNTDGTYNGKADCNQIAGSYTVSGSNITIEAGPSTMAACGDDSQDALFVAGLLSAKTWAIANGELTLTNEAGDTFTFKAG